MAGEQGGRGLRARSAAGPGPARQTEAAPARPAVSPTYGRPDPQEPVRPSLVHGAVPLRPSAAPVAPVTAARPAAAPVRPVPAPRPRVQPEPEPAPRRRPAAKVSVPESRVAYVSVVEASRETGASPSAVRAWARDGQVRSRTGTGPRGERTEVALVDVERLTVERAPAPAPQPEPEAAPARPAARPAARPRPAKARKKRTTSSALAVRGEPDPVSPGAQLVPMTTVEAMERLSGELYLAGQRAARAEAVAELRDRRLADLQQEVDDLQREATGLWEQNQELLRRVAVAEAQVMAMQQAQAEGQAQAAAQADAGAGESGWRRLRR